MHEKRIEGTVAEEYRDKITDVEKKDTEWRKQHDDMINAIREAKKNNIGSNANDPPIQLLT